jgi:formyl-CoA transferase
MPGPLADLRVIEIAQLIAGPFCGQLFADFGAEVIKVEQPGTGDPMRGWGPATAATGDKSVWWPTLARNKKSVTLDLRQPQGQALARDLIGRADVVIENMRPGTMERWGLGYDDLSKANPKLVMIRVTGFGQNGPYAQRPGYGSIGEAMGGLRAVMGDPDRPPSRAGISIGDSLAASFAFMGGLMAVHARHTTGRGQVVDSAIYEAVLAVMESLVTEYQLTGYERQRTGAILPGVAPSNVYPTADGQLVLIAANQDTVFKRLAEAMDRADLAEEFATHAARGQRQDELDELITKWTSGMTADELNQKLLDHAVPTGKIYRAADMLDDPHFAARQAIIRMIHPEFGEMAMQNVFPRLSDTPGEVRWLGPELGQHNDEIYCGLLGRSSAELRALESAGIL